MNGNIDWEDLMTKTERSASGAALNAGRAVGGVAKVLETQRHHSQQLRDLKKAMEELANRQSAPPSQITPPVDNAQNEEKISFLYPILGFAVVLILGMGLGAYFVS